MFTTSILYRARSLFLGLFAAAVIGTNAAAAEPAQVIGTDAAANAPTQQRPIEDFVMAQGTFFPGEFLIWTDPAAGLFTAIDYAGLLGFLGLGTEFSGSVTERALPDGRAMVHVRLHTTNAFSFGVDFIAGAVVFGNDPGAVIMGAEPGLGSSHLHVRFTNTAPGDPLPDLIQLLLDPAQGQALLYSQFVANAEGPLGDGSAGCLHTTQLTPIVMDNDINNGVVAEFIDITEGPCE